MVDNKIILIFEAPKTNDMYKKRKVVYLKGTNEAKKGEIVKVINKITIANVDPIMSKPFYIYILSDDPIKVSDWALNLLNDEVVKINSNNYTTKSFGTWKKVIATNDPELNKGWIRDEDPKREYPDYVMITTMNGLPKLSNSFIEHFIHRYNIKHPITDIMVEYDYITTNEDWSKRPVEISGYLKLKLSPDNTINTKEEQHVWNRYEVIEIARKAFNQGELNEGCTAAYKTFDDFIFDLIDDIQ